MLIWLNPPIAPTTADDTTTKVEAMEFLKYDINANGASFCHVKRIKHWIHSIFIITWGNQMWNGASPALTHIDKKIIKRKFLLKFCKKTILSITTAVIITVEAIAWTRKYLIADSVVILFKLIRIRGIILIKLISRTIQQINHELEEIAIKVPETRKKQNNIW